MIRSMRRGDISIVTAWLRWGRVGKRDAVRPSPGTYSFARTRGTSNESFD